MLTNALICVALVLIAVLFFWLVRQALRLRNPAARWSLALLASLPALLFTLVAGTIGVGYYQIYRPRQVPALALDTASTPQRVERGAHLARTTCVACHSTNNQLPLTGGIDLASHVAVPIGSLVPPNLTPGGSLKNWSDLEIAQAIRNGLHSNGRVLLMPTEALRNLSDEDVASLVAFLRSQPAVQHETVPVTLSPLAAFLAGAGLFPLGTPAMLDAVAAPPKQPDAAYGAYVLGYQDCRTCHGADLHGLPAGLGAGAPSVRSFLNAWTLEEFIQTMRTGVDPAGHAIQEPMPWQMLGQMDDVELAAIYHYIRSME